MKNKKAIIAIVIILIVFLTITILYFLKRNGVLNNNSNNQIDTSDVNDNSQPESNNTSGEKVINIKSTSDNEILLNEVEATDIEIVSYDNNLQVKTTLKNNSNEDVNGFFISIALLDKNGDQVTSVAENSEETIKANSELIIYNNVPQLENSNEIVNGRMILFEKNTIQGTLEDNFAEMEESVPAEE